MHLGEPAILFAHCGKALSFEETRFFTPQAILYVTCEMNRRAKSERKPRRTSDSWYFFTPRIGSIVRQYTNFYPPTSFTCLTHTTERRTERKRKEAGTHLGQLAVLVALGDRRLVQRVDERGGIDGRAALLVHIHIGPGAVGGQLLRQVDGGLVKGGLVVGQVTAQAWSRIPI